MSRGSVLLPLFVTGCFVLGDGTDPDPVPRPGDTDAVDTDSGLYSPDNDTDGDGVLDGDDVAPGDVYRCEDSDGDGCDDCTRKGSPDPANDGFDATGDGICELALDPDCLHGANASSDGSREDACIMLALVNEDRALFPEESGNAAPLAWNEDVWTVAVAHSRDMCQRMFFDHTNPDGQGPSDRAHAAGYSFDLAENIASGWDLFWAQYAFMAEPTCIGHRSNVLEPRADAVGIGVHVCTQPGVWNGALFVTQNFTWDWNISASPWCQVTANTCELPADPVSSAGTWCPSGDCDPVDNGTLAEWGCL